MCEGEHSWFIPDLNGTQTQHIRRQGIHLLGQSLAQGGAYPVHIPAYQFHIPYSTLPLPYCQNKSLFVNILILSSPPKLFLTFFQKNLTLVLPKLFFSCTLLSRATSATTWQGSSVVEQRTHKPLVGCSNHLPAIMGAVVTKKKW